MTEAWAVDLVPPLSAGILQLVALNAAAALNTNTSSGCEISSNFYGQKAAESLLTSYNDTFVGTHSGTPGAGIQHSISTVILGAWAGGGTAATTTFRDVFIGTNSATGAGGTLNDNTGVGFSSLSNLDGTSANKADWNTAVGDSAG